MSAHGGLPAAEGGAGHTRLACRALDACRGADLIVFSGGSSVGNRDLVTDLVAARGEMIFHGIAIKPGKPTAFALLNLSGQGGTIPFFGMPGNPTSCLSNAYLLVIPFCGHWRGFPSTRRTPSARRWGAESLRPSDAVSF